ncbi:flagellar hook-length control protein FliK [Planctomicrobium sp. SH668]|uniref:flagellar hook-length control protein FliK n=1 Tax=Planctomicrobium sp. SH668 TaxID=3448126 RepID=UPI003F5BEE50
MTDEVTGIARVIESVGSISISPGDGGQRSPFRTEKGDDSASVINFEEEVRVAIQNVGRQISPRPKLKGTSNSQDVELCFAELSKEIELEELQPETIIVAGPVLVPNSEVLRPSAQTEGASPVSSEGTTQPHHGNDWIFPNGAVIQRDGSWREKVHEQWSSRSESANASAKAPQLIELIDLQGATEIGSTSEVEGGQGRSGELSAESENLVESERHIDLPSMSESIPVDSALYEDASKAILLSGCELREDKTVAEEMAKTSQVESRFVVEGDSQRLQIRIDPPELGELGFEVRPNAAGGLDFQITAAESTTLDLLRQHRDELVQALNDGGTLSQHKNESHQQRAALLYEELLGEIEVTRLGNEARRQLESDRRQPADGQIGNGLSFRI